MPLLEAAWCGQCHDYVWLSADGQCSNGHARSQLRSVYDVTIDGPRPTWPPRPDGSPKKLPKPVAAPPKGQRVRGRPEKPAAVCFRKGHDWGPPVREAAHDQQCRRCGVWKGYKP